MKEPVPSRWYRGLPLSGPIHKREVTGSMRDYNTTVVGLDVHKATIVAAVLRPDEERVSWTTKIENDPGQVRKLVQRLQSRGALQFVYEAGPCGYQVHRELTALGQPCTIIAPGLTPTKPGDKVKTDRRDAEKLAKLHRAGELTAIRVPTREEEAARDLTRARETTVADRLRARHRVLKFLLRQGRVWSGGTPWGTKHLKWLDEQRFELEFLQQTYEAYLRALSEVNARLATLNQQVEDMAQIDSFRVIVRNLRCLRGIDTLTALTIAAETHDLRRFVSARALMGYTGLVSSEDSSGETVRRGRITKVGNAHLRRVLVEAAWAYSRGAGTGTKLRARRKDCPADVVAIAQKAQTRLSRKYSRMVGKGKCHQKAVVAVARELTGFVWAIGQVSSEVKA